MAKHWEASQPKLAKCYKRLLGAGGDPDIQYFFKTHEWTRQKKLIKAY
jgi:hypothetical protein